MHGLLWPSALIPLLAMSLLAWLYSLARTNVNIVDTFWSLFFLVATLIYAGFGQGTRSVFIMALVALWALRLSIYLGLRNHGKVEDRRYQDIRRNHSPGFAWKSLYIVFVLQAVLAWFISLPLFVAAVSSRPLNALDVVGGVITLGGIAFETIADRQLSAFKANPGNRGRVLNTGLWGWSRHPNYFGEACVWAGFGLIGVAAGSLWSVLAPVLMIGLLLKVSGVSLMEKDINERRPAYREYIARTSAFIPRPPRRSERDG